MLCILYLDLHWFNVIESCANTIGGGGTCTLEYVKYYKVVC